MRLEDTPEYQRGRNGEILMHSFAIEYGCTAFDIGGTAHGMAPILQSKFKNIKAPDALLLRSKPLWAEYKTKSTFFNKKKAAQDEKGNRIPPCLAHGINRRAYEDYQRADQLMPVTLWFLCITPAQLHVASLADLGEPFASVDTRFDMVNWPIERMYRIASFDRDRLQQFFRNRHTDLLPEAARKDLLDWLRPRQLEFEAFTEHFLTLAERGAV